MKAYLKRSKNDANDAAAICEAVTRPSIRTPPANAVVKIKLIEFATWALRCSTGGAAMQDVQAYLEKPRTDAVNCALISKRATDPQKRVLFDQLADHLAVLASALERAIEAKGP
jgi:hypothetical protein